MREKRNLIKNEFWIFADPFPPILRCPTDINAFEGEIIAWDEPTAKDNVGINKLELRFGKTNNTIFEAGRYLVVYAAKDFDGNEAICTFLISVFSTGKCKFVWNISTSDKSVTVIALISVLNIISFPVVFQFE